MKGHKIMKNIVHNILVELVCYHNDWGKLDFIRRMIIDIIRKGIRS
jgi:hypothetical protein